MRYLYDKDHYVIHYGALKQAIKYGLVLKQIYRASEFKQARIIEPYIKMNSAKRKAATSESKKNVLKLCNNSIYGKSLQNVALFKEFRLISHY